MLCVIINDILTMYNAIIITPNTPEIAQILQNEGLLFDNSGESIVIPCKEANLDDIVYYRHLYGYPIVNRVSVKLGHWE